jgi:endonuclease YncB( thermonuclease family)
MQGAMPGKGLLTNRLRIYGQIAVAAFTLWVPSASGSVAAEAISGISHVVDGDTLEIGGTKIRM